MHHSAAENLRPSRSFADRTACALAELALHIHLGRGFREGEIARAKACLRRAKEATRKVVEHRLEVHEADTLVHAEPLDLGEHRRVRRVEEIAPEHVSGCQDANRWWERLQRADLDG